MSHSQGRRAHCNREHQRIDVQRTRGRAHRASRALCLAVPSRKLALSPTAQRRAGWDRACLHLVRLLALLILVALASERALAAEPEDTSPVSVLALPVGQSLLMRYPNPKRVAAGDGNVIDVRVFDDTQEVLVLGKREGVTDLRIWGRDGSHIAYLVKVLGIPEPERIPERIEAQSTILIKAKLIEVKRSALRDIGIDWADVASGPIFGMLDEFVTNERFRVLPDGVARTFEGLPLGLGTNNHYFAMTSVVDSVVNLLVNNGDARLLAEPTLTCISGGQADFLVGGEVPIPVQNQDGALNVIFKQFGIILRIEPRTNDAGLIRTKVGVEVSSVDKGNQVLGIPGFATRKTNTEMNVQAGETMVVAGLFSAEDAKTVVEVPGLGHIPILGELFKSRQFRHGDSELVVLVTPQIVEPNDATVQAEARRFDDLKRKSDDALKPKLDD